MEVITNIKGAHDVIVVGGGIAGIAAAVSAARQGVSVLLIEKQVNLGGLATVGLISWYEPLCDGEGKQMIGGVCEELIRLAVKYGFDTLPVSWGGDGYAKERSNRFSTFYSPTMFELALNRYVTDAGVELLYDSRATYPDMDGNVCRGVIVENVSGRELYPAKVVIDASGDATLCYRAGMPCENGENYLCYLVHEFDRTGAEKYVNDHGDISRFRNWKNSGSDLDGHPEGMKRFVGVEADEVTAFMLAGKKRLMQKYEESGIDRHAHEIMMVPTMPQFRKIRRICGEATFDGETEALGCDRCIGVTGDFREKGKHFALPYEVLYNKSFANILAAGRIISSEGDGWEITRVIPVCALTGQAAGVAAAIASKDGCDVADVHYPKLKAALVNTGVIFFD